MQFLQLYAPVHVEFIFTSFAYEPQRYVNKDRDATKRIVQHAERRGTKALFITVDAPQLGRREKVGSSVEFQIPELI